MPLEGEEEVAAAAAAAASWVSLVITFQRNLIFVPYRSSLFPFILVDTDAIAGRGAKKGGGGRGGFLGKEDRNLSRFCNPKLMNRFSLTFFVLVAQTRLLAAARRVMMAVVVVVVVAEAA